jgi:predicted nucleic acid-binding protein
LRPAEAVKIPLTRSAQRYAKRSYAYPGSAVVEFCRNVATLSTIVDNLPEVSIVRDPEDDMIIASAMAAEADYLVSRDKDLLVLGEHEGIKIVSPEEFLHALRDVRQSLQSD